MECIGNFPHTMDPKGRISVPAVFRDSLLTDLRLVLAPRRYRGEPSLEVFPQAKWSEIMGQYDQLPIFSEERDLFQMFVGKTHRCEIDQSGRILVPPGLREEAELQREVMFVGLGSMFRLIARDKWEKLVSELEARPAGTASIFDVFRPR